MRRAAMAFLIVGFMVGEMVSGLGSRLRTSRSRRRPRLRPRRPGRTSAVWPNASRAKQYQGNKTVKVGGISLQIDADMVAGPVVRK